MKVYFLKWKRKKTIIYLLYNSISTKLSNLIEDNGQKCGNKGWRGKLQTPTPHLIDKVYIYCQYKTSKLQNFKNKNRLHIVSHIKLGKKNIL